MLNVSLFCSISSVQLPVASWGWSVVARSVHGKEGKTFWKVLGSIAVRWAPSSSSNTLEGSHDIQNSFSCSNPLIFMAPKTGQ